MKTEINDEFHENIEKEHISVLRSSIAHSCKKVFEDIEKKCNFETKIQEIYQCNREEFFRYAEYQRANLFESMYKNVKRFFTEEITKTSCISGFTTKQIGGTIQLTERLKQKRERGEIE